MEEYFFLLFLQQQQLFLFGNNENLLFFPLWQKTPQIFQINKEVEKEYFFPLFNGNGTLKMKKMKKKM
jgi:hypothetical protein